MLFTTSQPATVKLSICITTFNRAAFIGATLESILTQLTSDCEVVVLDGASTDDTEQVVSEYALRFDSLRYIRQDRNNGFDRDCDRVVELAHGEYCWLMTDDDLLKPGAVAKVLQVLRRDLSLVIVNTEARDFTMTKVLQSRWIAFATDRVYKAGEMDRLFVEVGDILKYVGGIVIMRAIWLAREKEQYYGSLFIYLGVIFQKPLPGESLVMAEPQISYRMGNAHTFSPNMFETLMIKWPSIVWSLNLSDSAKSKVCGKEPWRSSHELLVCRGRGCYSLAEYRRWIHPRLHSIVKTTVPALVALLPGVLVNAFCVIYYSVLRPRYRGVWEAGMVLEHLRRSPFYIRKYVSFKRAASRSIPGVSGQQLTPD